MTDAATTETTSDHSDSATPVPYRSGFVAVVGRPNVGKSTLINALIGTQIAIASSRPETTRKAIRGILTTDNAQIVLVDTPGIHRPRTLLGQRLNDVVDESLADVDAVAFLLPGNQEIGPGDKRILSRLRSDFAVKRDDGTFKWKVPLVAIVTKIDELSRDGLINKLIEINEFADFTDIVPVSALKHDNLAEVKNVLIENMPEGPQMYPAEQITEERPEETIAELVRGAFLEELDDELPHSLAVVVDSIEYPEDNDSGEAYDGNVQNISGKSGNNGTVGQDNTSTSGVSNSYEQYVTTSGYGEAKRRAGAGSGTAAYVVILRGNTNIPSPAQVSELSLIPKNASLEVNWQDSGDPVQTGTTLVYSTDHVPTSPTDGTAIDIPVVKAKSSENKQSRTLSGLENGKPVFVALFPYDKDKKYGIAKPDVEIPKTTTWYDKQQELETKLVKAQTEVVDYKAYYDRTQEVLK